MLIEWWMWLIIGGCWGYLLSKNKRGILNFFMDVDNQVNIAIASLFGLALFGITGLFVSLFLESLGWLWLPACVCILIFLAIMVCIYQPWKR